MSSKKSKRKKNKNLLELVMIVKNSGQEIIPMLEVAKKWIDHWTILDTGSTDETMQNITNCLKDVPGKLYDGKSLYEDPFVDFSTARNRALEAAGQRCVFSIMLDDTYCIQNGKELRKNLQKMRKRKESAYNLTINDETRSYQSYRIFRTSDSVRYKYRIHEVAMKTQGQRFCDDSLCTVFDKSSTYMQRRSQSRVTRDVEQPTSSAALRRR